MRQIYLLRSGFDRALTLTLSNTFREELEQRLRAGPYRLTSVVHLTNALAAEWEQIPTARFQNLVESLSRRVEAVVAAF